MTSDWSSDKVRFHGQISDQFGGRASRRAPSRRFCAAPQPARAGPSRRDPGGQTTSRVRPAVHTGPGGAARGVAGRCRRGLRAARRGGLSQQPARRDDPGLREGGRATGRARGPPCQAGIPAGLRLRPAGRHPVSAPGLAPISPPGPQRGPQRPLELSRSERCAGAARCPCSLPQQGPRHRCQPRADRHLQRLRPGARTRDPGRCGEWRNTAGGRGSGTERHDQGGDAGSPRRHFDPRRRRRHRCRRPRAGGSRRCRPHAGSPIPDWGRAVRGAEDGTRRLGRGPRTAGPRGRL